MGALIQVTQLGGLGAMDLFVRRDVVDELSLALPALRLVIFPLK